MGVFAKLGPGFEAEAASVESVAVAAVVVLATVLMAVVLMAVLHRYGSTTAPR